MRQMRPLDCSNKLSQLGVNLAIGPLLENLLTISRVVSVRLTQIAQGIEVLLLQFGFFCGLQNEKSDKGSLACLFRIWR